MMIFGPRPWGPALDDLGMMTSTPVGAECLRCGEAIADGDSGLLIPHFDGKQASLRAHHRECYMRDIVGSVGHLERRCPCFGGTEEDPPGMTKRQAARAAMLIAKRQWARGIF